MIRAVRRTPPVSTTPASGWFKGDATLLYSAYEMQRAMLGTASNWASVGARLLDNPALPLGYMGMGPAFASALKVFAHLYEDRGKPDFDIQPIESDGETHYVSETVVLEKPFGNFASLRA